ncbi:hypothetical protein SPILM97S_02653 [Streptomyces pilosus]
MPPGTAGNRGTGIVRRARLTMRPVLDGRGPPGILVRMLTHQTFVFTYGTRPAGCHGRAA